MTSDRRPIRSKPGSNEGRIRAPITTMEGEMTASQTIDVSALIEDRPVSAFQWRTLFVCVSVLFMDGYDTQADRKSVV